VKVVRGNKTGGQGLKKKEKTKKKWFCFNSEKEKEEKKRSSRKIALNNSPSRSRDRPGAHTWCEKGERKKKE